MIVQITSTERNICNYEVPNRRTQKVNCKETQGFLGESVLIGALGDLPAQGDQAGDRKGRLHGFRFKV